MLVSVSQVWLVKIIREAERSETETCLRAMERRRLGSVRLSKKEHDKADFSRIAGTRGDKRLPQIKIGTRFKALETCALCIGKKMEEKDHRLRRQRVL